MDHERFREWFSHVDELTTAQCKEVAAVLSDPPVGAASLAAIELGVDDERRCPHAPAPGRCRAARHAVFAAIGARPAGRHSAHSRARRCRACTIRSAGWPSAPRLAQARRSERLPSAAGLRRARRIAGVSFLAAVRQAPDRLAGIVEADETCSREPEGGAEAGASRAGAAARPANAASRRAGADGCRRSRRRDPQPHLARPQRKEREGGAGAGRPAMPCSSPTPTAAIRERRWATRASTAAGERVRSRRSTAATARSS